MKNTLYTILVCLIIMSCADGKPGREAPGGVSVYTVKQDGGTKRDYRTSGYGLRIEDGPLGLGSRFFIYDGYLGMVYKTGNMRRARNILAEKIPSGTDLYYYRFCSISPVNEGELLAEFAALCREHAIRFIPDSDKTIICTAPGG